MKIIEVLQKVANGEIKEGTKFILNNDLFIFNGRVFESGLYFLENRMFLMEEDLNQEVELIPPKEKKYLIKLNVRGLLTIRNYLNYYNDGIKQWNELGSKSGGGFYQTCFTKQEMQDIKLVREFLEDMQGKFELIEVEENEID